jgi:hypothetical protein
MTIYKVQDGNMVVEFATEEQALLYAQANNCEAPTSEEREVVAAPEPIPDVTPRQIRQALILSGISLQDIDNALATLPEPTKSLAMTEWEYSIAFQRNRPLVASVGQMLGWTSEQLDDLWLMAATL